MTDDIDHEQISAITAFVDTATPPSDEPTAHLIFGTNQIRPAEIAAERYHRGLAPMIIVTGGVNRHNGIVEAAMFHRFLLERGVPDDVIRYEDRSANTWQNIEFALPFLREALERELTVTAICKWYHRRAIHILKTFVPDIGAFHVITWDPVYAGQPVTRTNWPHIPDGRRRVIREWQEVPRRVAEGSFTDVKLVNGTWH
ncbi:YdcF family protein [Streptosporangium sp. NPDC020072]|uniref:YdcF family protein n=1 Tax=Streptosporangium jomthongense TaxID=1193683 RepID=A0ABV8F006_9ACTN